MWILVLVLGVISIGDAQHNGDVRLSGGLLFGRVEIYLSEKWGTIQYDPSSQHQRGAAQAICRQLGYYDVTYFSSVTDPFFNYPSGNGTNWLRHLRCPYSKDPANAVPHIMRCNYDLDGSSDHSHDMAVLCIRDYLSEKTYDTQVRLVEGNISSSGFLEVYLREVWGPVCNMQKHDADSACRQLGYTNAIEYTERTDYKDILDDSLSDFTCTESKPCLRSCFSYPTEGDVINCNGSHTFLACAFNTNYKNESYGSSSLCSTDLVPVGMIVGVTIAVVFVVLLFLITVMACCCCIPGCILHKARKRNKYQTINS